MDLAENIYFSVIGIIIFALIIFLWLLFKRKKKAALIFSSLLILDYASYFFYYPIQKEKKREERLAELISYLEEKYPTRMFTVNPTTVETGVPVGEFYVNDTETTEVGVTFSVNEEGEVTQTS